MSGRCIGVVDLYAPVQTQYGKFDVQAQTDTGIEAQLPVETVEWKTAAGEGAECRSANQILPTSTNVAP